MSDASTVSSTSPQSRSTTDAGQAGAQPPPAPPRPAPVDKVDKSPTETERGHASVSNVVSSINAMRGSRSSRPVGSAWPAGHGSRTPHPARPAANGDRSRATHYDPRDQTQLGRYQYDVGHGQKLTVLGTTHSHDPHNPFYQKYGKAIDDYMANTPPGKQVFVVEGKDPTPYGSGEAAIKNGGEFGYLAYKVGGKAKIDEGSPLNEKIARQRSDYLRRRGFTPQDIARLDEFRMLSARPGQLISAADMQKMMLMIGRGSGLQSPQSPSRFTQSQLQDLNGYLRPYLGRDLVTPEGAGYRVCDISNNDKNRVTDSMRITRAEADFRNQQLRQRLQYWIQRGYSPMVVYGNEHGLALDPVFSRRYRVISRPD